MSLLGQSSPWLDPQTWWAIFQVVIGLGTVIFVHELGHFLVAKACGVQCDKFYVGFDFFDIKIGDRVLIPRRLVYWQWGETEYGIGIIPLGGYVKMLGQDDNPAKMAEERERAMMSEGDDAQKTALDPRSFMAKTVPQRMAIISAGVIMNLIFAVIFATFAFRAGVNFEPPIAGLTIPGSPAWENNLTGCRILSINGNRSDDKYYTFQHLTEAIVLGGYDGPLELELLRPGQDKPETLKVETVANLLGIKGGENLKSLGFSPIRNTQLSRTDPVVNSQAAAEATPPLAALDQITAVNGTPLETSIDLRRILARFPDKPVVFTVERRNENDRSSPQTLEISVPPNPLRSLGLIMDAGPIRSIRHGSPAEKSQLQVDDKILTVDGEPLGNPFTLQYRMLQKARTSQAVALGIRRLVDGAEQELVVTITPELPYVTSTSSSKTGIAVESLGITLPIRNIVSEHHLHEADREATALQAGDEIIKTRAILNEEQSQISYLSDLANEVDLVEFPESWASVFSNFQNCAPGTRVELTFRRGHEEQTTQLTLANVSDHYQETRGFVLQLAQEFYQSSTTWDAVQTGFQQTIYDASRVLNFLKKLVRGQLSIKQFGGPATIAVVATSEANQGTSRLLLFLTLLSANLAIINFLPIPVLDGGHMVFLAFEGIFRRPVGERLQVALSIAGFVFLLALMLTVIGLDIWRFT